jgi:hypothetical protein
MIISHLHMFRTGDNGPLKGSITIQGTAGAVSLQLDEASCQRIIDVMRTGMRSCLDALATGLRTEIESRT